MKNIFLCCLVASFAVVALHAEEAPAKPDAVAARHKPELDRLKKDYDTKVRLVRLRMIADYENELRTALAAKNLDQANALKAKLEDLKSATSQEFLIVGKWNITQSNKVNASWAFNPDRTYTYWNETGQWKYSGGKYILTHTWDWEITMPDEKTFEGVCTRGGIGTKIRGVRIE